MKKRISLIVCIIALFVLSSCFQVEAVILVPGPPKNPTVVRSFGRYDNLTWEAPDDTNVPEITGYKIEYAQNYHLCSAPKSACWMVLEANTGSTDTFYSREISGYYSYYLLN